MSEQRRPIPERFRRALFGMSRGHCYAPDCREPMVVIDHDEPVFVGSVAHIVASSKDGPRGDEPIANREAFSNLLLLCGRHHTLVDDERTWRNYPSKMLRAWKREREKDIDANTLAALDGLGSVEQILPALLVQSFKETVAELSATVDRLEESGHLLHGTAELLREAVDAMPALDPDLHRTARLLMQFADAMPDLGRSARSLGSFADGVSSRELQRLATVLGNFLDQGGIRKLAISVDGLNRALREMPTAHDVRELRAATTQRVTVVPDEAKPSSRSSWEEGDSAFLAKAAVTIGLIGLLVGSFIVGGLWYHRSSAANDERQACTGASASPGFAVKRKVKVRATPSVSSSPYICPTWYVPRSPRSTD